MESEFSLINSPVSELDEFIVSASQAESQPDAAASLPALKQIEQKSDDYSDSEVVYPVIETFEGKSGSFVLVADSEVERMEKCLISDGIQIIEESDSEENLEPELVASGTSSDDAANITVIEKDVGTEVQLEDCPLSQDLFKKRMEEEEEFPVAIQSRYFPSLPLSGEPMLVPETVEESLGDQEICPSPEAYGTVPLIIPSTPIETSLLEALRHSHSKNSSAKLLNQERAADYNPESVRTLASQPVQSSKEDIVGPIMATDLPGWQQSQSLNLCLTSSSSGTQLDSQLQQSNKLIEQMESPMRASVSEGKITESKNRDESQMLHLCMSQSQNSSQLSGNFSIMVPKYASGSSLDSNEAGKIAAKSITLSSSNGENTTLIAENSKASVSLRPAMSISMVHSESQGTSETTYQLERPSITGLEPSEETVEGKNSEENIFLRTCHGKRIVVREAANFLSDESEDFLYINHVEKSAEIESLLSGCSATTHSQNLLKSNLPREQEKLESPERGKEQCQELEDPFSMNTVWDIEPEEESSVQPFESYPVVSRVSDASSLITVEAVKQSKNKTRGTLDRRRKCLIKKKNETNSRIVIKSSSTSADESTNSKQLIKSLKKAKNPHKFTRLQKKAADFKRPAMPSYRLSRSKGGLDDDVIVNGLIDSEGKHPIIIGSVYRPPNTGVKEKDTTADAQSIQPSVEYSAVTLHPVSVSLVKKPDSDTYSISSSSNARTESKLAGGSQNSQKLLKRKSVDFSSIVQVGSPPQQLSLEKSLSDSQSSDMVIEVTRVTQYVMRYVKQTTVVQHINKAGQLIQEKITEEEGNHEVIEENELSKKRRLTLPLSPSRSVSTVTSGDLADISSSSGKELSQPNVLPSALIRETGSASSTPKIQTCVPLRLCDPLSPPTLLLECIDATTTKHSAASKSFISVSPLASIISPDQSTIERDDSRLDAVVTSSSSARASESLYSADNMPSSELPCSQLPPLTSLSSSSTSSGLILPSSEEGDQQKKARGSINHSKKLARRAPADSSQENNKPIEKKVLPPESQSFQPGNYSGGFNVNHSESPKKGSSISLDKTVKHSAETSSKRAGAPCSSLVEMESSSVTEAKQEDSSGMNTSSMSVQTVSYLELDARVMCRWKDGFFYPAKFIGLNTGIGNKFKVLFEDGMEKTVRAVDLVMAQNLPLGQSVLVMGDDGICDPGIILKHIINDKDFNKKGEVAYDVTMDDGSVKRCKRSSLLLSEDQASFLLSDGEYRASFGEGDISHVNTADVSLDNVIQGKRLRTKGSPAVGVPRSSKASTRAVTSDDNNALSPQPVRVEKSSSSQEQAVDRKSSRCSTSKCSAVKRKLGPVATSTPTPKQMRTTDRKHETPKKPMRESFSPLGAIVASPEQEKRPTRKVRVGLFESVKGPIPKQPGLFTGCVFLLTHVDKLPANLEEEKRQLQDSSMESSAGEATDDGVGVAQVPFDKNHLKAQIKGGGGTICCNFSSSQMGPGKKVYLISDTYQRTLKYMQCLAANVPIVSHIWIRDSCVQNQLLDYKAYVLPAGISLEKHRLMERDYTVSCLAGLQILLTSSVDDYFETWNSVLEIAKCKVLTKFPQSAAKRQPGVDFVLSDHTCSDSIVDKSQHLGVPIVSSEWLIQCLINNTKLSHDSHPKYAHDYYKDAIKNSAWEPQKKVLSVHF